MPPSSPENQPPIAPHPLACALIERLRPHTSSRIVEFATGSGRNVSAMRAAGFTVTGVGDDYPAHVARLPQGEFDAVLSTHGLLHGTAATVCSRVIDLAKLLRPGGLLYAVFGSVRDARFGNGTQIDDRTFAPNEGDELGVPHAYFNRAELKEVLSPHLHIERMEEHDVDEIAGQWAHMSRPLSGAVHWFVIARMSSIGAG